MLTINGWRDLERYGIDALTGEACGLMYRLLCDLTAMGREIIRHWLGTPELSLYAPWNSGTKEVWLLKSCSLLGIEPADDQAQVAQS